MFTLKSLFDSLITDFKILDSVLTDTEDEDSQIIKYKINYKNLKTSVVTSIESIQCILLNTSKISNTNIINDYDADVNYMLTEICNDIIKALVNLNICTTNKSILLYRIKQYITAILNYSEYINSKYDIDIYVSNVAFLIDKIDIINTERNKLMKIFDSENDALNDKKFITGLIKMVDSKAYSDSFGKIIFAVYSIGKFKK